MIFLLCGFISALIATLKGRSGLVWFMVGALFPIVGILLSAIVPRVR